MCQSTGNIHRNAITQGFQKIIALIITLYIPHESVSLEHLDNSRVIFQKKIENMTISEMISRRWRSKPSVVVVIQEMLVISYIYFYLVTN